MPRLRLLLAALGFLLGVWTADVLAAARTPDNIGAVDSAMTDSTALVGKVVYVDFWASWCVPCRKAYPFMKELSAKYQDKGLVVVTINLDKDRKAADKFLAEMNTPLPVIYDPRGDFAKLYQLKVMPSSFVYGRDGRLREQHEGFHPADGPGLDSLIASLIKEAPPQ